MCPWPHKDVRKGIKCPDFSLSAFSLGLSLKTELGWWLVNPTDRVLSSLAPELQAIMATPGFLGEFWRFELRSLCYCRKHSYLLRNFLSPCFFFFSLILWAYQVWTFLKFLDFILFNSIYLSVTSCKRPLHRLESFLVPSIFDSSLSLILSPIRNSGTVILKVLEKME